MINYTQSVGEEIIVKNDRETMFFIDEELVSGCYRCYVTVLYGELETVPTDRAETTADDSVIEFEAFAKTNSKTLHQALHHNKTLLPIEHS